MDKTATLKELKAKHPGEETYLISDDCCDITAGKEAGIDNIIVVTYGWGLKEALIAAKPNQIFNTVDELSRYLHSII